MPDDLEYCDSGTVAIPVHVSDHKATYITLPYHYELNSSFERIVWLYKRTNFELLNQYIRDFDWNCLLQISVNETCDIFTTKVVPIRNDDKPWLGSELR